MYRRGWVEQAGSLKICWAVEQVHWEKAVETKTNEEQEWVMCPTNTAASIPLSLSIPPATAPLSTNPQLNWNKYRQNMQEPHECDSHMCPRCISKMPTLSSRVHLDLSRPFFDYWEAPLLDIHLRIFKGSFSWKWDFAAGLVFSGRPGT